MEFSEDDTWTPIYMDQGGEGYSQFPHCRQAWIILLLLIMTICSDIIRTGIDLVLLGTPFMLRFSSNVRTCSTNVLLIECHNSVLSVERGNEGVWTPHGEACSSTEDCTGSPSGVLCTFYRKFHWCLSSRLVFSVSFFLCMVLLFDII